MSELKHKEEVAKLTQLRKERAEAEWEAQRKIAERSQRLRDEEKYKKAQEVIDYFRECFDSNSSELYSYSIFRCDLAHNSLDDMCYYLKLIGLETEFVDPDELCVSLTKPRHPYDIEP